MGSMLAFNLRAQDVADRTFDHLSLSYGEAADSGALGKGYRSPTRPTSGPPGLGG